MQYMNILYMLVYVCLCVYTCAVVCMCVYECTCMFMCVYDVCLYVYVCGYVCIASLCSVGLAGEPPTRLLNDGLLQKRVTCKSLVHPPC